MDKQCPKYEKRLSAYLDGQLSPDEMAEIAAHLEDCPACSAQLDKMSRLEEMAGDMVPPFDDALLNELAKKVEAGLNRIDEMQEEPRGQKAAVVPIWYRYAAVAASVVIVFFVGRMAFIETAPDVAEQRLPSYYMKPSPSLDVDRSDEIQDIKFMKDSESPEVEKQAQPSLEIDDLMLNMQRDKKGAEKISKGEGVSTDESKKAVRASKPSISDKSKEIAMPRVVPDEEEHVAAEEDIAAFAPVADIPAMVGGKITDQMTGEPLSGVAVQLSGTKIGSVSDSDGQFEITPVEPGTYDLVYSTVGYGTVLIDDVPLNPNESTRFYVEMQPMVMALGEVAEVSGRRKGIDLGKATVESAAASGEEEDERQHPMTIDSLDKLYTALVSVAYKPSAAEYSSASPAFRRYSIQVDKAVSLLDSLELSRATAKLDSRIESYYLQARANYDIYLQTREEIYLKRATEFKSILLQTIDESLEHGEKYDLLIDYKDDIERWNF